MEPIEKYQEELNNIKGWLDNPKTIPWELLNADFENIELWKKQCPRQYAIQTIQELIDYCNKLEKALKNCKKCQGCIEMKEAFKKNEQNKR